jgi:DNA-binding MarR family transcriptional regulator
MPVQKLQKMGLEKEINQQKPFPNSRFKAIVNVIYTYHWTTDRLKKLFMRQNLTMQQYNILRILRGNKGPMSIQTIRSRMLDKMSDTSRLVDRLVRKSLVKKKLSDHDRRQADISITRKGLELLGQIDGYDREITALYAGLSDSEAQLLNRLLDKIRNP